MQIMKKEEFYKMINNEEIELFDYFDEDDKNEILNSEDIYNNYIIAFKEYSKNKRQKVTTKYKYDDFVMEFYFDTYGEIKEICICADFGDELLMHITNRAY